MRRIVALWCFCVALVIPTTAYASTGTDLSNWNPGNSNAITFVIAKVTEGTNFLDKRYEDHKAYARANGLLFGSYHYADGYDPVNEARFYVAHNDRRNGEVQALDFEGKILNRSDAVSWAETWLQTVELLTGNKPVIYMSESVANRFNWSRVVQGGYGLWCAAWHSQPCHASQWHVVTIWQYSDNGRLPGIGSRVDLDTFGGTFTDWQAIGGAITTVAVTFHVVDVPRVKIKVLPKVTVPVYVVRRGDTLSRIGQRLHIKWQTIYNLNKNRIGKNPNRIYAGERLALR